MVSKWCIDYLITEQFVFPIMESSHNYIWTIQYIIFLKDNPQIQNIKSNETFFKILLDLNHAIIDQKFKDIFTYGSKVCFIILIHLKIVFWVK